MIYLKGVEDVLPYIQGGVSVSEGQNNELRIYADDRLDVYCLFLDNVGMNGSV